MYVEIKDCPFCGRKAELIGLDGKHDIRCTNINCYLSYGAGWECSSEEVINMWNYRKQ